LAGRLGTWLAIMASLARSQAVPSGIMKPISAPKPTSRTPALEANPANREGQNQIIMKTLAAAIVIVATALGCMNGQAGSPPGGEIKHIGPLSGEPSDMPPLQAPELTAAQKTAIFRSVILDKSRSGSTENLDVAVGQPVPTVDLHPLPPDALAQAPAARQYRYTLLADQVVLVDPRTLRVVDVIKP
jgi:hypothetical protein